MATETASKGVLGQHRDRMENDPEYRESALTAPPATRGKYLTNTAPTAMAADREAEADPALAGTVQEPRSIDSTLPLELGNVDDLAGEDLDEAVRKADIEGRSEMTADEKRAALKKL